MDNLYSKYSSSACGLSSSQAEANKKYGLNILQAQKKEGFLKKFILQFKNLMIIVLLVSAIVSAVVSISTKTYDDLIESAIIFAIVIINAIIGVFQENKAEAALALLSNKSAPQSKVLRDGKITIINSSEVVVGDIVILKSGDLVPADIVLIDSNMLRTNESSLTGESTDVDKKHIDNINDIQHFTDKSTMCFSGTCVTSGNAKGIVVAVGKNTEIGKIAKLLTTRRDKTPLEKNMERIGKVITYGVFIVVAIVFLSQLIFNKNFDFMQSFLTAIALAVAAIPESLPAVITIIMALGVERLAKHGAIVKTLSSVETLGSCTCLCTDKTGTLTQNKMQVKTVYANNKLYTSNFYNSTFNLLLTAINCCNNAQESNHEYIGDATETSLKDFVKQHSKQIYLQKQQKLDELPFDSTRKTMFTHNKINNNIYVFGKGAFDRLINNCSHILINDKLVEINETIFAELSLAHKTMATKGQRVIAVAYKESKTFTQDNLVLLGLVGIIDPPRKQVYQSISQCISAGLKPIMITGDHPETAFAIAKDLNIASSKTQVITGDELDKLSTKELAKKINNFSVFARVSPVHKTKIVMALKKQGQIVGFAGDGINDAPSVRNANIGICMGSGTDVTKSAADLIASTNDYSTIVLAIKQGRTIYTNIQKTLLFLISTNMVEVLGLFVSAIVLPSVTFLLPSQILFINLVTDSLPAFALGLEKAEKDIMQKPPRNPNSTIFSGIGWHILLQGFAQTFIVLIQFVISLNLWGNAVASSMVFITICLMQLLHAINCKTLRSITKVNLFNNKTFNISFISLLILIIGVSVFPFAQSLFSITSLNTVQWLIVVCASISIIPIVEICKYIINHPIKKNRHKK